VGSICCNLVPSPAPGRVFDALKAIRARPDVADVRVAVTAFDDPAWPFSDTVWVLTGAPAEAVPGSFPEPLRPDEVWEGWGDGAGLERCEVPAGVRPGSGRSGAGGVADSTARSFTRGCS